MEEPLQAHQVTRDVLMEALIRGEEAEILRDSVTAFQQLLCQNLDRLGLGIVCFVQEFSDRVDIVLLDMGDLIDPEEEETLENSRKLGEISVPKFKPEKLVLSPAPASPAYEIPPLYCSPQVRHRYE